MKKIHLLACISFLAAFLLFQIELIVSKLLLPNYGGSFLVWGASVVFFQCTLLAGYLYTHLVVKRYGIPRYGFFHMAVIMLPLVSFPAKSLAPFILHDKVPMVFDIFMNLALGIGIVFFVLSTISVILQAWVAQSSLPEKSNPYILYGVSNLGSFLALITYPFLVEVFTDANQQLFAWRVGYGVFAVLYIIGLMLIRTQPSAEVPGTVPPAGQVAWFKKDRSIVDLRQYGSWFLYGCAGSVAFLTVTNILTYEILPGPFLWIFPLCIYLLSFTMVFSRKSWCPAWITGKPHLMFSASTAIFLMTQKTMLPVMIDVLCFYWVLFVICMYCQKKLYDIRPVEASGLTTFYLIISTGGFLGSIVVTWLAPLMFPSMVEFLFAPGMIALAMMLSQGKTPWNWQAGRYAAYMLVTVYLWSLATPGFGYNVFLVVTLCVVLWHTFKRMLADPKVLLAGFLVLVFLGQRADLTWPQQPPIYSQRNYYGIYRISMMGQVVRFVHGSILHGAQYATQEKRSLPITYFHPNSPIGKVLTSSVFDVKRMGVIGLGVGTLAAYGKEGEMIDFYEIDPDVLYMASTFFTYLKDSKATITHYIGDARLSVARKPDKSYNVLVVDAFTGDSIPTHLVTLEAFKEYRRVLDSDGFLIVQSSNRYLNLESLMVRNARELGAYSVFAYYLAKPGVPDIDNKSSKWVFVTWNKDTYEKLVKVLYPEGNIPIPKLSYKLRPWTDAYYNLLAIFEGKNMLESLRTFQPFSW